MAQNRIELMTHFAVPIFKTTIPEFNDHRDGILARIQALQKQEQGMQRSNLRGWHSEDKLQLDQDPHIAWLMQRLQQFASACVDNVLGQQPHGPVGIGSAWANINPKGSWNMPHMHLPADWSGVFYVQVNDEHFEHRGDGDLIFIDPMPTGEQYRRKGTVNLRPHTGLVVLFPSYVMHMVAPHQGDSNRISIAFNCRVASNV